VTQHGGRVFLEHQHESSDGSVKLAFESDGADIPRAKYHVRSTEISSSLLGDLECCPVNVNPDDGALVANYLTKKQGDVADSAADIKYVHTTANAGSYQHPDHERPHYFGLFDQPFVLANAAAKDIIGVSHRARF
jgi:hypothetical protein